MGPLVGTFAGFANWLSIALKAAFALVGIGSIALAFTPEGGEGLVKVVAIIATALFGVLNAMSVKGAGRLQTALVVGLLAILCVYVATGLPQVKHPHYSPFLPYGWQSLFAVAGMVFVSYGGLTKVASVAEEVRDPGRNIPLGMLLAFFGVNALYVAAVFVTVGVVPAEELAGSLTPIADGARAFLGRGGAVAVEIAALLAFITTANAGILSAARSPMAMSRDGLLPSVIANTSKRFGTPHLSIALTTGVIMATIAFLSVEDLVKTASTIMIVMFILVHLAVLIMRKSGVQNYRPQWRAPLFPWLQIAAVVIYAFLLIEMGFIPLLLTGAFTLACCLWYLGYVHRRIDRESAFVFLVRRLVSREMAGRELEDELRHIALERDEVQLDRFDELVHTCPILDVEEKLTPENFFQQAAETLAQRLDADTDDIRQRLLARERESSTVLRPGLAVPHIIVDGEGRFELLVLRSQGGVAFDEVHEPIHAAFVLAGSRDERNLHLKALMAIAHVVEQPEFDKRWLAARGPEELRDLLILSGRRRHQQQAE
jgi:amino acid transporter/mannitol/fructose-specific phosphotransferase system IIA component (Ntr-type)